MNHIKKYLCSSRKRFPADRWPACLILFGLCGALLCPGAMAALQTLEVQISSGGDDGEEDATSVTLSSSDLELTLDKDINQTVGLRFNNVNIPKGQQISRAYVQFQVDEPGSTPTTLTIHGQAAGNAQPFSNASGDISARLRTAASVEWIPSPWPTAGIAGIDQRTSDISAVIQEIIDHQDWANGNSMVLIITGDGNGRRVAESYNGDSAGAPILHVEYGATSGNEAPSVDAGADQRLILPTDTLCLQGTASDDGVPAGLSVNWTQQSGPAAALVENPAALSTTVSFPSAGTYNMALRATDGELTVTDDLLVTVGRRIDVPGDAPTIQAGVDLANDGDIVIVAPGVYQENVDIEAKTITLASRYYLTGDPADIAATVIDGGGRDASSVVFFHSSVGPTTTIMGLTIQNASNGVQTVSPINILYNRFTNTVDGIQYDSKGGGLALGNEFFENIDDGIDINRHSNVVLERNIVRDNGGDGIEIRLNHDDGPVEIVMRGNTLINNDDDGIQLIDCDGYTQRVMIIERNLIAGNNESGLGIMGNCQTVETFEGASALEAVFVTNNTFVGNDHGITGGDNLTARNNIFVNHANVAVKNVDGDSSLSGNLFWNNGTDVVASNVDSGSTLFLDPVLDEDYHPLPGSYAIDAGVDVGFPFNGLAPDIGAFETPVNAAPIVNAGEDQSIAWSGGPVDLSGIASDDGLPAPPGALTVSWKQISGPCGVLFGDPKAPATTAMFEQPGTYTLRLSADDGELSSSDEVTFEILENSLPNRPPVANDDSASTDEATPVTVNVVANDSDPDDDLHPASTNTACAACSSPTGGTLQNNGDGTLTYTPTTGFSGDDSFVYEVCDAQLLCDVATVTITVIGVPVAATEIEVRVMDGNDDAEEEQAAGKVFFTSSDLELVDDVSKGFKQVVGIRFAGVTVPNGVNIDAAYVQFHTDDASSDPANLAIAAELNDDAPAFTSSRWNISSRPTTAPVTWVPAPWTKWGEAGVDQRTGDLAGLIQQVVNRPGWRSGNAIALIFTGEGMRTARSYDGQAAAAPSLYIKYSAAAGN